MPAPSTNDEFLDLVKKSGVVDEKRLSAHLDRGRASGTLPADPLGLATQLVHEGVLTHFQAEQFLAGKWRRFMIGKYKVLERLGAGGMGQVYLCEHTLMRRRVALKVLPNARSKDSSSIDRFYREARAVAALDHPNIVRAYDIDHEDTLHFLVMEHVDGASLQEMVKRAGEGMDPIRAAHYIRQAALGLQHAHEAARLVHRDIKPGNILVDRNGIVKVLDMGLARFFHDEEDPLTQQYDEKVLGTADYLAPEQAQDSHEVDIRADIYSLGGTFYYCLTGRTPFAEGSVAQKLIWHQMRQPKSIKQYRTDVPDELVAIVERMMAKDPAHRFQTPQEVADALEPWTRTPIAPPPDREMPQLSLAATRALNATGDSATGSGSGKGPDSGSRKKWKVNGGPGSGETATPETATVPPVMTPVPRPAAPMPSPVPRMELPATRPLAPHAVPPPTRVPLPEPIPPPELQPIEDEPESDLEFRPSSSPTRREGRKPARRADERGAMPPALKIGLAVGGVAALAAIGLSLYLFVFTKPPIRQPAARQPLRVNAKTPGGLRQVLKDARDGDRIILETDLSDDRIEVSNKSNLTIEGAEGKAIRWVAPAAPPDFAKLLLVSGCTNLTVKNLTLDGEGRTQGLIQVFAKCDGLRLEGVTLRGMREHGIMFINCEGSSEKPMTVTGVKLETARPEQSAVRFQNGTAHKTILKVSHLVLRDLTFIGPGRKLTQRVAGDVDAATVEVPSGLSIETVP